MSDYNLEYPDRPLSECVKQCLVRIVVLEGNNKHLEYLCEGLADASRYLIQLASQVRHILGYSERFLCVDYSSCSEEDSWVWLEISSTLNLLVTWTHPDDDKGFVDLLQELPLDAKSEERSSSSSYFSLSNGKRLTVSLREAAIDSSKVQNTVIEEICDTLFFLSIAGQVVVQVWLQAQNSGQLSEEDVVLLVNQVTGVSRRKGVADQSHLLSELLLPSS